MQKLYSLIKVYKYYLLFLFLPLIFFGKVIFDQNYMLYPSQDIISIFSQEKNLFQDSIKTSGAFPFWNPYIFSGSPFLGNPTSAMFYPINLLFLIFPVDSVFSYVFMIDTILIGVFTYLFAKSIKLDNFSSFLSAITIMFSGPILTLIFPGHLVNFDTFIWFPLILLIYEKAIKKQKIIYAIIVAFPIALTLFAGASQIAVFSLLSAFIYFSLRTITNLPKINKSLYLRKTFVIFFLSIIIGFLLAAIQIIPTSEFSKLSARSDGLNYGFASDFSLHPKQVISFIFPYFFGNPANGTYWGKGNFWSLNGYIGILPLLLTAIALLIKPKRLSIIFLILGLFALLFSFGKYSFVFPFFFKYVPQFDSFRAPARFLYVYVFSFSILAGIGVNSFIQKTSISKKYLSKIFIAILTTSIIFLITSILLIFNKNLQIYEKYILNNSYAVGINHLRLYFQFTNDIIMFSLVLLIFAISLFLRIKNKKSTNIFKTLLILIILSDLWFFSSKFISVRKINEVYTIPNLIRIIKNDKESFRIFDKKNLYLPVTERNKIENITGVHSLYIKDYRDFVWAIGDHENKPYESFFQIKKIQHTIFLNLLNVKYIIENNELIKNADFLPRAYVVPNAIILPKQEIFSKLKNKDFDPKKQIILQKNPGVNLTNFSSFKEVKIYHKEPNKIKLKTSLDAPGFLVLSEIDYPGWKAYDNDKELEIFNADYILRSVYLTKGSHKISFTYEPTSYTVGRNISILTLLLCFLFLIIKKAFSLIDIKKLFL